MAWSKAPAELVERFGAVLPSDPAVIRKQTFGYPSAVVGGHMFASLHEDRMILRLPDAQLDEFMRTDGGAPFEPMPGRPMKGFAVVPAALLADDDKLRAWVEQAFLGAAALPPKEAKARSRTKKSA